MKHKHTSGYYTDRHVRANMFLYAVSILTLLLTFALLVYFSVMLFIPITVLEVKQHPLPILTPVVPQGGVFQYHVDACKLRPYKGKISRELVNGTRHFLGVQQDNNAPVGCFKQTISDTVIPEYIHPGEYRVRILIEYEITPFRTESYTFETETFRVVSKDEWKTMQ